MLRILLGNTWKQVDRTELALMILHGVVNDSTQATDTTIDPEARPLLDLLQQEDFERLGEMLLGAVRRMYVLGPDGVNADWLRGRVAELADWGWPEPHGQLIMQRLVWLAGFLAEVTGNFDQALRRYDQYLADGAIDANLRLIALNNRGVLRIRQGLAEGVGDLLRAVIKSDPGESGDARPVQGLPIAAFNILNLLNLCASNDVLSLGVDRAIRQYCKWVGLDNADKSTWFGPAPRPKDKNGEPAGEEGNTTNVEHLIYKDPRRMASFIARLSRRFTELAYDFDGDLSRIDEELQLWHVRPQFDVAGQSETEATGRHFDHKSCGEVTSILYACEVPTSLSPSLRNFAYDEKIIRQRLREVDKQLEGGRFAAAQRTIKYVIAALGGAAEEGEWATELRDQAESKQKEVELKVKRWQLGQLLEKYSALIKQLDELEQNSPDPCQAERQVTSILSQIEETKQSMSETWSPEFASVYKELEERAEEILCEARLKHLENALREPWQEYRDALPQTWEAPVPDAAYVALQKCRSIDPEGRCEDWESLSRKLDEHQARHFYEIARRTLASDKLPTWHDVKPLLSRATIMDPKLAHAVAPMALLLLRPPQAPLPADIDEIREELHTHIGELLAAEPFSDTTAAYPTARSDLVTGTVLAMKQFTQGFLNVGGQLTELYELLEDASECVLECGTPEVLEILRAQLEQCLDACPVVAPSMAGRRHPNNPIARVLERVDIAELLAEGDINLHGVELNTSAAAEAYSEALRRGIGTQEQLWRAVEGLALSGLLTERPKEAQRHILDGLKTWVDGMGGADAWRECTPEIVQEKIQSLD